MGKGLFIVLEGIDGAGTTTQARRLAEWLEAQGRVVMLTAEPTDGPVGQIIRQILQGRLTRGDTGEPVAADETTMALLFAADRSYHLQNIILPALGAGKVVVSDRHYISSVAYQSVGVEMAWVETLNARFRRPDLTVMLDIAPEASLRRKQAQGQPAERYEKLRTLEAVRAGYLEAIEHARAAGERIDILDGDGGIDAIEARIRELVAPVLASE